MADPLRQLLTGALAGAAATAPMTAVMDVLHPALPGTPILELKPALYHAGPDVMLAVLRHARADTVMMIGHNPGIAEFAGTTAEDLFERADRSLYRSKHLGRDRITCAE